MQKSTQSRCPNSRPKRLGPLPTRVRGEVRYFDIPLWETGGVDFDEVFAGLRAIGYDGTVTVHQQYARLMGPQEAAEKSYEYLAELA